MQLDAAQLYQFRMYFCDLEQTWIIQHLSLWNSMQFNYSDLCAFQTQIYKLLKSYEPKGTPLYDTYEHLYNVIENMRVALYNRKIQSI